MIDRTALLNDLTRLVTRVEADLLARSEDSQVPEIAEVLRGEYERARAAHPGRRCVVAQSGRCLQETGRTHMRAPTQRPPA